MSLATGDRLGPYVIVAPIGAGGMGEVYRARDTKLDREVAIKVLPAALAQHPDRLARFEREAKVLAALNHPNIAMIHGLEDRAIVMELVEGPTLADRLRTGPIPLEESLRIAAQIADALEAAHERGIVHRDLKPANIKVRDDGTVKVLDFGLATAIQSGAGQPGDGANSPTLTMGATEAGVILGTAAYMSPEQAAGKPVDRRADIWSFGVVLWEMLTGRRLFEGETVSHTLADVLRAPIDFEKLPKQMPTGIRELLRRCLDRNARTRLRDIGEARIAIQKYLGDPAGSTKGSQQAEAPLGKFLWPAVAGIFGVALAGVAFIHLHEAPPQVRVVNTTLLPPDGAEFDFGTTYAVPALSPDGTRIVFGAKSKDGKTQLYVRRLDSSAAQPLPGTEGAAFPFWSPDSRWVGFGQATKLKKIDIQGGPAVTVADGVKGTFRGGSWNSEGVIVFGENNGTSIMRVAAEGGTAVPATPSAMRDGSGNGSPVYPWFLPDGRHFLYTGRQPGDIPVRIGSVDEPGKTGKVVAQANSNAVYAEGHLLYLRENTLMAQPFDAERLETKGEAVPLAEGIPTYTSPSRGAAFTVSAGGLLAYQTGGAGAGFRLVWKDRQGKALGSLGEPVNSLFDLHLSPDGKSLAGVVAGQNADIWIYDTARGIPTRFTFSSGGARYPVWSPDGNTIYYFSGRSSLVDLVRKASNGAGAEELLLSDNADKVPTSVAPDGKALLYEKLDGTTKFDLWVLPLAPVGSGGKTKPRLFLQTPFNEAGGNFSPDGHWVAYLSDESGQYEAYVIPYPGPGGKRQISFGGARNIRWRGDGKELFYSTRSGELMAAEVDARNGTLEIGRVQKLFDGIIQNAGTYVVSGDGQKFLVVENIAGSGAPRPLTLLQNWPALQSTQLAQQPGFRK